MRKNEIESGANRTVAAIVFLKNEKVKNFGEIMAGLGVLFIDMDMMGMAMKPLADSEGDLMSYYTNYLYGGKMDTGKCSCPVWR